MPLASQVEVADKMSPRDEIHRSLVDNFYESDKFDHVKLILQRRFDAKGVQGFDDAPFISGVEGEIFEEMALDYYYNHLAKNPENRALASFLQEILAHRSARELAFFSPSEFGENSQVSDESVENWKDPSNLNATLNLFPGSRSTENPDALLVNITTDAQTGKKVARIVGALDAKIGGVIKAKQIDGFKINLTRLVEGLKPHYKEIIKNLDLEGVLPENMEINSKEHLSVAKILPQTSPEKAYTKDLSKPNVYVPTTRSEIHDIVMKMVNDVVHPRDAT